MDRVPSDSLDDLRRELTAARAAQKAEAEARVAAEASRRRSEEHFRQLVDHAPDAVFLHDLEGRFTDMNEAACVLLGYSREELLTRRPWDFVVRDSREQILALWQSMLPGQPVTVEDELRRKDATVFPVEVRLGRFPAGDGESQDLIIAICRDITDRKRAEDALRAEIAERTRVERELRESQRFLENIADTAPAVIYVYDLVAQRNVYASRGMGEILGYTPEEVQAMGTSVFDRLLHPEDLALLGERLARQLALADGQTFDTEYRMRRADGEWRWLQSRELVFRRTEDGAPGQILGFALDVTGRRQAEQVARAQVAVLTRTLRILAEEPVLDPFLGHVLSAITDQLNVTSSGLFLFDPDTGTATLHMSAYDGTVRPGHDDAAHPLGGRSLPVDRESPYWKAMESTRRPVIIDDPAAATLYPYLREWAREAEVRKLVLVPLLLGDTLIGWIGVRCRDEQPHPPEALELAQALAHQATLALHLTRLAEQGRQAAVLEERNRLAREIHDTLAQGFTGIVLQLEAAEAALEDAPEDARLRVDRAKALARESLAEARRSVRALRPRVLEAGDLVAALRALAERLTVASGVAIQFSLRGTPTPLVPDVADNLLRIAQEALANALSHARPSLVQVDLAFTQGAVALSIGDDGLGFDLPAALAKADGLGLTTMRERAERIGAAFELETRAGHGAQVRVEVPREAAVFA